MKHVRIATYDIKKGSFQELAEVAEDQMLREFRDQPGPNWQAGEQPGHWYYWRREVLAYQSGLVFSLAGRLRAPKCYLMSQRADGNVALWLEDLRGTTPAIRWPLRQYSVASRHLGHAQGAFVAGRSLPDDPWLSRSWLRAYLTQRDADTPLLQDDAAWATSLVREWLSQSMAGPSWTCDAIRNPSCGPWIARRTPCVTLTFIRRTSSVRTTRPS